MRRFSRGRRRRVVSRRPVRGRRMGGFKRRRGAVGRRRVAPMRIGYRM